MFFLHLITPCFPAMGGGGIWNWNVPRRWFNGGLKRKRRFGGLPAPAGEVSSNPVLAASEGSLTEEQKPVKLVPLYSPDDITKDIGCRSEKSDGGKGFVLVCTLDQGAVKYTVTITKPFGNSIQNIDSIEQSDLKRLFLCSRPDDDISYTRKLSPSPELSGDVSSSKNCRERG